MNVLGFKKSFNLTTLGLAVTAILIWICINFASYYALSVFKMDGSDGKIFSLSSHSKNLLSELKSPITIRLFYSSGLGQNNPVIHRYAQRVKSLLQQYQLSSHGHIKLEYIDPKPFSEPEDLAVSYGIQGIPFDASGNKLYFGIAISNAADDILTIPYLDIEKEKFLEYELSRTLYDLIHPEKKQIAIITSIPLGDYVPAGKELQFRPWVILQQLQELYTLNIIDPQSTTKLPNNIDVLWIIQPDQLNNTLLKDIDQFVLQGGKTIIMADPLLEGSQVNTVKNPTHFGLDPLFEAWGIAIDPSLVVGDNAQATPVMHNQDPNAPQISYLPWPTLTDSSFSKSDPVTANLHKMQLASAGFIQKTKSTTSLSPLLSSSADSMPINASIVRRAEPKELLTHFKSENKPYMISGRLNGVLQTAFPGSPISVSKRPPQVVLIADIDILLDRFWTEVRDVYGQPVAVPFSENGFFILNLLDQFSGGNDLIHLRSKSALNRPFTRVERIKQQAEKRYLAKERELQHSIISLENQIQKESNGPINKATLSSANNGHLQELKDQLIKSRKALREVNLSLRTDIEHLYLIIKIIGIALVPSLLLLGAFVHFLYLRQKQHISHLYE